MCPQIAAGLAVVTLVLLYGMGQNPAEAQDQTPIPADYHPRNLSATYNDQTNEINVVFDAASNFTAGNNYRARYKQAGTNRYTSISDDFSPFELTVQPATRTFAIRDCSGTAGVTVCVSVQPGTTFTIEVAQINNEAMPQTVPTGTDADYAQFNYSVPLGEFSSAPIVDALGFGSEGVIRCSENCSLTEGDEQFLVVTIDAPPTGDSSADVIYDEPAGGSADLSDVHISAEQVIFSPTKVTAFLRITAVDDRVVEADETAFVTLVNWNGLYGDDSENQFEFTIIDNDTTSLSLGTDPPTFFSPAGAVEDDSGYTLTATLDKPLDSRCAVGWALDLAANPDEQLTKLSQDDFSATIPESGNFIFESGESEKTLTFPINNDNLPEFAETATLSTNESLNCQTTYQSGKISDIAQQAELRIAANDIPEITSLEPGAGQQQDLDRAITLAWSTGDADLTLIESYRVRWTKEVAGQGDEYYLDSVNNEIWQIRDISDTTTKAFTVPPGGRTLIGRTKLDPASTYLVQVGAKISASENLIFSSELDRVTTGPEITAQISVSDTEIVEGNKFEVSAELTGALSNISQIELRLVRDATTTAEEGDFQEMAESIVFPEGQTQGEAGQTQGDSVTFGTTRDDDLDDETLILRVTASIFQIGISDPEQVLTILEESTPQTTPTSAPSVQTSPTQPTATQPAIQPSSPTNAQSTQPTGGTGGGFPNLGSGGSGSVVLFGGSPSLANSPTNTAEEFADAVGTTHEDNIGMLAEMGITRGCNPPTNSRFCPERAVTRGEMATFMVRAFELPTSDSNLFADDNGSTHEANINALAAAEITRGCNPPANTRYCPDRPVTRAQMATFLARAMDLQEGSGGFSDTASSPHSSDINRIATAEITRGCNPPDNTRFCPDRAVTRGEMATFLVRAQDMGSS